MKIILSILFSTIVMNGFSQLKPVPSGVIRWNDLPVKKEGHLQVAC